MTTDYKTTIGLEIHAELKTQTKMFCGCKNDPLEKKPNVNVCPICLAHPGTLPTINKRAVELMIVIGSALGGKLLRQSHFDRKSYFYPDLPKGYQISQYEEPFVKGGELVGVEITRVHLEEDTARLNHDKEGSYLDYNRAGLPLMELVTEPVIDSAEKALELARELQLILRYLGASDADMEKGQMRVEPNISVAPRGSKELGTKVELKNINSFKAVGKAIVYEVLRQREVLENGDKVVQETRGWDDKKQITKIIHNMEVQSGSSNIITTFLDQKDKSDTSSTISNVSINTGATYEQRVKEEADDYRYMPEPDLPSINFEAEGSIDVASAERSVPELPQEKRERFMKEFGLREDQVEVLVRDRYVAEYFEETVSELSTMGKGPKKNLRLVVNYLTSDIMGLLNEKGSSIRDLKISPENFAELTLLIEKGEISSRVAKDILREMFETGADPSNIIKEKDLGQVFDEGEIEKVVKKIIEENKKAVEDYKKGKETVVKFLIGQAMAELRGRGNPELLEKLFREHLPK